MHEGDDDDDDNNNNNNKYLGIEEIEGTQHQQMKERMKKEYSRRLSMILKSELNAKNKTTAIGALDVRVEIQFWFN
jgi:hypothetical protein